MKYNHKNKVPCVIMIYKVRNSKYVIMVSNSYIFDFDGSKAFLNGFHVDIITNN
jgi:hypothetical protein